MGSADNDLPNTIRNAAHDTNAHPFSSSPLLLSHRLFSILLYSALLCPALTLLCSLPYRQEHANWTGVSCQLLLYFRLKPCGLECLELLLCLRYMRTFELLLCFRHMPTRQSHDLRRYFSTSATCQLDSMIFGLVRMSLIDL